MIGSGLKKLAAQNGMRVAQGVAYGSLQGYAATFSEGSGYKQIVITTRFADPVQEDGLRREVGSRNIASDFRVKNLSFAPNGINVVFLDNPGTMKKIEAFLQWFLPLLDKYGADKVDICNECGQPLNGAGTWILRDGVVAFHMHAACVQKVQRDSAAEYERRTEADSGDYLRGTIGALLGAAVGAVLWAVIYMMGYVAGIVGFAIGWLAEKGYDLLHGKQGKGKVVILIVAVILGVLLGTAAGLVAEVMVVLADEGISATVGEVIEFVGIMWEMDSEFQGTMILNVLMGLAFAGLGVFTLLRQTNKNVSKEKITVLQ